MCTWPLVHNPAPLTPYNLSLLGTSAKPVSKGMLHSRLNPCYESSNSGGSAATYDTPRKLGYTDGVGACQYTSAPYPPVLEGACTPLANDNDRHKHTYMSAKDYAIMEQQHRRQPLMKPWLGQIHNPCRTVRAQHIGCRMMCGWVGARACPLSLSLALSLLILILILILISLS